MVIPSYDDLTPGIPDVAESGSALEEQLALFLANTPRGSSQVPTPNSQLPNSNSQVSNSNSQVPNSNFQVPTSNSQIGSWALGVGSLFACLRLTRNSQLPIPNSQLPTANCQLPTLLGIARDFSPRVMVASDCEVLLDVAGLGRLIGEPPEIARQLARAMYDAGLTASVALAPTQTAARMLATQRPDYPIARFPDLPIALLKPLETLPPGINHRDRARPYETFERWGIATLADLAALPAAELSSRLGRRGIALQRLARGLDPKPFVPDGETPRFMARLELEWPLDALEPLSFVFARLLDPLSAALERADRGAVAVHLDLRLTDRSTCTRLLQLPAPMRDPRVLRTLLLLDLESNPPSPLGGFGEAGPRSPLGGFGEAGSVTAAVDVVAIELDPAPARVTQFSLLQRALPSPETLSTLTARLSALVGDACVGSPALEDTHRADAFVMERYAPDGAKGADAADAAKGTPVLRRFRNPSAIRVSVTNGRPVHLASSRRGMPYGAIVEAAGPWRTSGGWWTDRSWSRNEWDVALASGAVCRIFQDRTTERWFLEALYD